MALPVTAPVNVSAHSQSSLFFQNASNPYGPPSFTSNLMPVLSLPITPPTPAYPKEAKELFIGHNLLLFIVYLYRYFFGLSLNNR